MLANRGPVNSSLRVYGARGGCTLETAGFVHTRGVRPRLPGRPKYGQPSFHVTGDNAVSRPTEFASIIEKPHHSPAGVSTMPPWCIDMCPRPVTFGGFNTICAFVPLPLTR